MKKTLILGASTNPQRYSYKAIKRLTAAGHEIIAVGRNEGKVADVLIATIYPEELDQLHTVTIYLRPEVQTEFYSQVLNSNPKRIIFNPGTENYEFAQLAKEKGIETINACTLVMLSINDY